MLNNHNRMKTDVRVLLSKKLRNVANQITAAEIIEAVETLDISRPTIDKYLSGDVSKIDVGTRILEFFSRKIKERIDLIMSANIGTV